MSFLMPLLCVGPSVQRCHRHVKIVDMFDQSIRTRLFLLILVRCVLALLIPRRDTVTGFRTKSQGNGPQHLIHVQLIDQRPCITTRAVVLGF